MCWSNVHLYKLCISTDENGTPAPRPEDHRVACPQSYSIIMDNLDFFVHTHNQSISSSNKSIHWIHHIAVQDRIPTDHISNIKPTTDIQQYRLRSSLPQQSTQGFLRCEFTILATRMMTKHMAAFESFGDTVVHHIPHLYSSEMSRKSTDVRCKQGMQMWLFFSFSFFFKTCSHL